MLLTLGNNSTFGGNKSISEEVIKNTNISFYPWKKKTKRLMPKTLNAVVAEEDEVAIYNMPECNTCS